MFLMVYILRENFQPCWVYVSLYLIRISCIFLKTVINGVSFLTNTAS